MRVSYAEAARWSKLAADGGHGGAAYNLAKIYGAGRPGLAADRGEAEVGEGRDGEGVS